jgi:hypothetical protein
VHPLPGPVAIDMGLLKYFSFLVRNQIYEGYLESNLWRNVNKTRKEKILLLYTKNTHILKLFLKVATAGIEALVSGNKFLYVCVKEICRLRPQPGSDTFHKLLIIVEVL